MIFSHVKRYGKAIFVWAALPPGKLLLRVLVSSALDKASPSQKVFLRRDAEMANHSIDQIIHLNKISLSRELTDNEWDAVHGHAIAVRQVLDRLKRACGICAS